MVRFSWKELTALSVLLLPVLSSAPAAARPDGNDRLSSARETQRAMRLNDRIMRQQANIRTAGWGSSRTQVSPPNVQSVSAIPGLISGIPRSESFRRNSYYGGARGGLLRNSELSVRNLGSIDSRTPGALNLDLSSTEKSVMLSSRLFRGQPWITVDVGGTTKTFSEGTLVTPAEYVAISQSLSGNGQSLSLNSDGTAKSGQVSLSMLRQPQGFRHISDLVIPEHVVALDDLSRGALRISGDIVNHGQIVGMTSPGRRDGKIFADNLLNLAGAVISMDSLINTTGVDSKSSVFLNNLASIAEGARAAGNLLISASEKVVNDGTIFSSGNLTVSASEVRNHGLMMSGSELTIESRKIVNSGVVKTMGALLNLTAGAAVDGLSVVNTGGTIEATHGNLVLSAIGPIDVAGGALNARLVKLYSPVALVSVAVDSISGLVDLAAYASAVHVQKGDLAINSIKVAGDPIFTNSSGSITLPATITASGAPVTAVAYGDIIGHANGTLIDTSSTTGDGGEVILLAGVSNVTTGGTTKVSGPSGSNGSIYGISGIKTAGDTNSKAGDVTIGAFGGSITITGEIDVSSRDAGHVTVLAPGDIKLADVTSKGHHTQDDYITIRTVNPSLGSGLTFDSNGMLTQGTVGMAAAIDAGSITAGNLESGSRGNNGGDAGNINIMSGGSISTGYLRTMGGGAQPRGWAYQGYDYASNGGHGGNISVVSKTGGILIDGDVNSSGGGGGGANHTIGGRGGDGGNVLLTAIADIVINGPLLAPGGGGGGGVGISSTDTAGGGGSLGNGGGPNSGGIFYSPAPYDGPAYLDNGLNPRNPNRHRFPYAGMGGSNTAYDIGCCGSGFGGNVGEPGENGDQGTFLPRGWWNDITPKPGGAPGKGGNITASGRDISVTETIETFYDRKNISKSPYAQFSVFTHSKGGGSSINLTTSSGSVSNTLYAAISDLESTAKNVTAQLRSGQVSLAGQMRGSVVSMNGKALPTTVEAGILPGASNASLAIVENGASKTISNGDSITSSEWIALIQKATTGSQNIELGAGGIAKSGNFDITSANVSSSGFSSLVIPSNVTAAVKTAVLNVANGNIKGNLLFAADGTVNSDHLTVGGKIEAPDKSLTINTPQLNLNGGSKVSAGHVNLNSSSVNVATNGIATIDSSNLTNIGLAGQAISFANTSGTAASLKLTGGPITVIGTNFANALNNTLLFNGKTSIVLSGPQFQNSGQIVANDANGNGGDFSISSTATNFAVGAGELSVAPLAAGGGHGGSLAIAAELGSLSLSNSVLDGSAAGSGDFHGGNVSLIAKTLSLPGAGQSISANGVGNGAGGSVSIITTAIGSNLLVDGKSGNLKISAHGGSAGSANGAGGGVVLKSGGNLTIDSSAINVGPLGINGDGGHYDLEAGTASSGVLSFIGAINADGIGNGSGGSIRAVTNSPTILTIGTGSSNGISGKLSANGGSSSGVGGTIRIGNTSGGIDLTDASSVSAKATNGNGGHLHVISETGSVNLAAGNYSFNGAGTNGAGGSMSIEGAQVSVDAGGAKLSANGSGQGDGGLLSLTVNGNQDLTMNSAFITMSATGGSPGSTAGSGGKISISSGGDLLVDTNSVKAGTLGTAGIGASYSLAAGTASSGRLVVDGSLDASGKGNGSAGNLDLQFTDPQTFKIGGSGPSHGITGALSALGAGSGEDGKISIGNPTNKLIVDINTSLQAGEVDFESIDDIVVTADGSLSGKISAAGKGVSILNQSGGLQFNEVTAGINGVTLTAMGGNLDVGSAIQSKGDIELAASGQLNIGSSITSDTSAKLSTFGLSSVIFNGGTVEAPIASIQTENGDILSTSSATVVDAESLDLSSTTGDIGNAGMKLNVSATNLAINTGGAGVVNVGNVSTNALELGDSSAGGSFNFSASGPVSLNDIVTTGGAISVTTSAGKLYIAPNATISAVDGDVTIQNNDFKGTIALGANSTINTKSSINGLGDVYIGFGSQPAEFPRPKKKFKNIVLIPTNGGAIYTDKAGLKAAAPLNTFTADGKNIFFTNNSKKKRDALVIEGNVNISAL